MNQSLMAEYAQICADLKNLEEKKMNIGADILAHLQEQNVDTYSFDLGAFSIVTRKTYEYSEAVKALKETMETAKKHEEEAGIAEVKETRSLRFLPVKI